MPIRKLDKKIYGAKKYRGISELYKKSDGTVSGYYYSYQNEIGKTVKIKASITEKMGTKAAVDEAAAQKAQALVDRDKKLSTIKKIGRPAAVALDMTVDDLMEESLLRQEKPYKRKKKIVPGRTQQAINKDRRAYERLAKPLIGTMKIKDVEEQDIELIQSDVMGKGYKQATITNLMIVLQAAFNYADTRKYSTQRPFRDFEVKKEDPDKHMRILKNEEIVEIFTKAEQLHPDLYFHVQMLYYTIQRPASISALTVADVDFENNQIHIKIIKGQPARKFPISGDMLPILVRMCQDKEQADRLETISPKYMSKLATVLFEEMNETLYFTKAMRERSDALEIATARHAAYKNRRMDWISLYSFRHTGATNMYNDTGDIYLVQTAMNHKTPTMTQRYAKPDPDRIKQALPKKLGGMK